MTLFKRNKNKDINFTELTPIRKHAHEFDSDGLVHVLVPKFTDPILSKLLQPRLKDKFIKADFDEFGTTLWLLLNGTNKVEDIVKAMKMKFGDKVEPAYERVTIFLQNLHKNKLIYFLELNKE